LNLNLKLLDKFNVFELVEEMEKLYVGQGYDLYWSFHNECPTFEDYISMVDYSKFLCLISLTIT